MEADDAALRAYYERGMERERLSDGRGNLEFTRTTEIVLRRLPAAPAAVADIGGGPGRYALWLASLGYQVEHRDLMPLHVEQLRADTAGMAGIRTAVGDVRDLDLPDASVDAVLLLGPLYHLTDRAERVRALRECARIVRPGGAVFAAAISRWAARIDGMLRERLYLTYPAALGVIDEIDRTGMLPPLGEGAFTGFFHRPGELRDEVAEAGLEVGDLVSVEGPAFILGDLDARMADPVDRSVALEVARAIERVPELTGFGPHLIATGIRSLACPGPLAEDRRVMVGPDIAAPGDDTIMPAHAPNPPAQQRTTGQVNDLLPLGDWVRHHSLRSWPVLLFLALICVPSIALVILGSNPSASTFDHVAWIFAAYFAVAWLLLLGVIIRPEHVTRTMLGVVTAVALVTQVPLAIALETALHSGTAALGQSIFTIGIPEELAKAVPVLVVGLIYRRSHGLMPRDYLFLGAVSGLVFGASEVVHYFTVNGIEQFFQTVKSAIPAIEQMLNSGQSASTSVFEVLIGSVLYFILNFVWRFVTDPVTHACWAGLTGYFIGLAVTGRHKWYVVVWIGLVAAAVLHGLNDWDRINGQPAWILVALVSGILFLGYAKVGSRGDPHVPEGWSALGAHPAPDGQPGRTKPWWAH